MTDQEFVTKVLEGCGDATEAFEQRFRRLIWALTTRILRRHPNRWEDANQEVWLRIWHKLADWRGGSLKSWVGTVATNRLIDIVNEIEPPESLPADLVDKTSENPAKIVTDEEDARRRERCQQCIQEAVAQLADTERRLVESLLEDIPAVQIHEDLGLPHATYYYLRAKIFAKLKETCARYCGNSG